MHTTNAHHVTRAEIERMDLLGLDDLRHALRLPKKALCERCDIQPSTYTRWMRRMRGHAGGCSPQPRSLRAVRSVLADEVEARRRPRAVAAE